MKHPQVVTLIVLTLFMTSVFSFSRYAISSFRSVIASSQQDTAAYGFTISNGEDEHILSDEKEKPCPLAESAESEQNDENVFARENLIEWMEVDLFTNGKSNASLPAEMNVAGELYKILSVRL
ncbi:MAG: hypothetical protein WBB45_05455 [Cyclobacteriaceae bacterium]